MLALSALGLLVGGCTSATEQEAQRFLSAVHADPLYSWRPGWVTKEATSESTAGLGVAAETRTEVSRALNGGGMPSDAIGIATSYVYSVGWMQASSGLINKYVVTDGVEVRLTVRIYLYGATQLIIDFTD